MRRALILCPATVLSHWMAELRVWAPQLRVVVLHRCVQAFNAVSGSSGTGVECSVSLPLPQCHCILRLVIIESQQRYSSSSGLIKVAVHTPALFANEISLPRPYSKQGNFEK